MTPMAKLFIGNCAGNTILIVVINGTNMSQENWRKMKK